MSVMENTFETLNGSHNNNNKMLYGDNSGKFVNRKDFCIVVPLSLHQDFDNE